MTFSQSSFDALGAPAAASPAVAAVVIPPLPGAGRDLAIRANPALILQSVIGFIRQQNDPRPVFADELPVNQEGISVELKSCHAADDFAGYLSCECLVSAAMRDAVQAAGQGALLAAKCRAEVFATPYYRLLQICAGDWQLLPGDGKMLPRAVFSLKFVINTATVN